MADDGSTEDATWPLPKFSFMVNWGTQKDIAFQEVSGLDKEVQVIEYRAGNSSVYSPIKMPGLAKYGNVTMKRGVFVKDNTFTDWMNQISMNTIARRTVLIMLLDENQAPTMQWQLLNAWPTKIVSTDMKSDSNEVAIESIEIAYEQLIITNS